MSGIANATEEYKGVLVPSKLRAVIPYMLDLELVRERLSVLGHQWDLLTILGQVCGTGTDMTTTREEFNALTHELISNLGLETLEKFSDMLHFKAQVAIDIIIRNLFERTADIGFLATDDDVRHFVESSAGDSERTAPLHVALRERFAEYVAKYSVYEDIVLFDPSGGVLCRLDESPAPNASATRFIHEALHTSSAYIEYFGPCDIYPGQGDKLIYAYRVNDRSGNPAAVLSLTFGFELELRAVFDNLIGRHDWTVLGLLDPTGKVIASSDSLQMPCGTQLSQVPLDEPQILRLGGRAYLARACRTKGYQGYAGLGWYGCALLPLEHAFNATGPATNAAPPHFIKAIADNPELFSRSLKELVQKADGVQAELDRTVWNGHLPESDSQSVQNLSARKVLLREISATGGRTKEVFERAIGNLYQTVVSSVLSDAGYAASLAIDIMDRNLYERANDCRWWALTPTFRRALSASASTDARDAAELERILRHINGLYTVYTSLFIFDSQGRVVASSAAHVARGQQGVSADEARRVLSLKTTQDYVVSPFAASELYDGRPTYIYAAPIRDVVAARNVGGIGVVFDSQPQFGQMLRDALPCERDGRVLHGCRAVFVERSGRVIACSDDGYQPGARIDVPAAFLTLANGQSRREIVQAADGLYAVGGECSHGYREFKSSRDNYRNDVIALVFLRLSDLPDARHSAAPGDAKVAYPKRSFNESAVEVATFRIGELWLGLPAKDVIEAVPLTAITAIPSSSNAVKGVVRYRNTSALVVDARHLLAGQMGSASGADNIIVMRLDGSYVGLVVDELGEVPDVPLRAVESANIAFGLDSAYLEGVIKPDTSTPGASLVLLLRTREFIELVMGAKLRPDTLTSLQQAAGSVRVQAAE